MVLVLWGDLRYPSHLWGQGLGSLVDTAHEAFYWVRLEPGAPPGNRYAPGFGPEQPGVILALPLSYCVTSEKFVNLSESQSSHQDKIVFLRNVVRVI